MGRFLYALAWELDLSFGFPVHQWKVCLLLKEKIIKAKYGSLRQHALISTGTWSISMYSRTRGPGFKSSTLKLYYNTFKKKKVKMLPLLWYGDWNPLHFPRAHGSSLWNREIRYCLISFVSWEMLPPLHSAPTSLARA